MAKFTVKGQPFVINGVKQVITQTFDTETWQEELASMSQRLEESDEKLEKHSELTEYTYSDELYSDLFKDVNGWRPRGIIWDNWCAKTPAEKQHEWDALCSEL